MGSKNKKGQSLNLPPAAWLLTCLRSTGRGLSATDLHPSHNPPNQPTNLASVQLPERTISSSFFRVYSEARRSRHSGTDRAFAMGRAPWLCRIRRPSLPRHPASQQQTIGSRSVRGLLASLLPTPPCKYLAKQLHSTPGGLVCPFPVRSASS